MSRILISLKKTGFSEGLSESESRKSDTSRKRYCKILFLFSEKRVLLST